MSSGFIVRRGGGIAGYYTKDEINQLLEGVVYTTHDNPTTSFNQTSVDLAHGAVEFREAELVGVSQSSISYAPKITFVWDGRYTRSLALQSDGTLAILDHSGVLSTLTASGVSGATWNDYAEFRQSFEEIPPGRVAAEDPEHDDYITLCNSRLNPTAMIVSDTYGFDIGKQDKAGEISIPTAVSGRVLAYPDNPRESFKVGDSVCSAPGGTVSKMTREEIREYPDCIIGTVSSIPSYERWGTGNVKVDGRIWIKVR